MTQEEPDRGEVILSVRGLSKRFRLHEPGRDFTAFEGLDFDVRAGGVTLLAGRSGSGKSSALRCIYRTYLPGGGSARYVTAAGEHVDLLGLDEYPVQQLRRRELAFVTQFLHCLPRKSALDVVARPLLALGASRALAIERASTLLSELGIPERLWALPPVTFSGGEKQRVNIARGCVTEPRLLLLDEPTASLDADASARVSRLIGRALSRGSGVLAVFHDSAPVAGLPQRVVQIPEPSRPAAAGA
jgi:alpha-D-ribose 1-methylphosphonate 5-triphosphate synthase subunit PhnL